MFLDILVANPVVQSLSRAILDDVLFEEACDAMVEVFRTYDNVERDYIVALQFAPHVLQLHNRFRQAADEMDSTVCTGLCRVFTEMAESYAEIIITHNQGQFIELLLSCMAYSDAEVADITFNFWFQYTKRLGKMSQVQIEQHKVYLVKLTSSCIHTLQFPEEFQDLPEDQQQDFVSDV